MVEDAGNIDGVEAIALKLPPEPMPENPDPDPDPEGMKVPPIPDELDDPDNPDDELGPPKKLDADADDIVVVVENWGIEAGDRGDGGGGLGRAENKPNEELKDGAIDGICIGAIFAVGAAIPLDPEDPELAKWLPESDDRVPATPPMLLEIIYDGDGSMYSTGLVCGTSTIS